MAILVVFVVCAALILILHLSTKANFQNYKTTIKANFQYYKTKYPKAPADNSRSGSVGSMRVFAPSSVKWLDVRRMPRCRSGK